MSDEVFDFDNNEAELATAVIQSTMDKFLDTANVDKVYGRPIRSGETIIIPTAEVVCGLGFGVGSGRGGAFGIPDEDEEEAGSQNAGGIGSGGGGGGRVLSRPVAVIVASPEGVRVEPVFDRTKILMAALTAVGFMFGMLGRIRRQRFEED
jgi:uncharacterized spore protein YtfJ